MLNTFTICMCCAARSATRRRRDFERLGIGTGIHYATPVHLQPAYRGRISLGPAGCLASEAAASQVLSLPMYPELTDPQVSRICDALRGI